MATRAEIEAEMAQRLGTAPKKRTRAEIEAEMAQKLGSFKAPQAMSEYEKSAEYRDLRDRAFRDLEKDQSFLENAAIGAGGAVAGMGRGLQQLGARAIGADEKLAELQAEEADIRSRMKPVSESAGGITGNILANAAMFLAPGSAVTKAGQAAGKTAVLAPRAAQLLTAMLGEGALGAVGGALQPTVEGESLAENVKSSAALNALFPALGAGIKSAPVQKAADTVLDYTPILAGRRREARNLVTKAAHDAEVAAVKAANAEAKQKYAAEVAADRAGYKQAVATTKEQQRAAELEAKRQTQYAQALRDQEAVQKATFLDTVAQEKFAKQAGWDKYPQNKLEFEDQIKRLGSEYGALIEPVRMQMPKVDDILARPNSTIGRYVEKLSPEPKNVSADALLMGKRSDGFIKGETYKEVRSDITEALQTAEGDARADLKDLLARLDANFEAAIPPDKLADVVKKREQYAISSTVRSGKWRPDEGMDLAAVMDRLDKREIAPEVRDDLYKWYRAREQAKDVGRVDEFLPDNIPEPDLPPVREAPELLPAPAPLKLEKADVVRLMGTVGGLGSLMGYGLGAAPAGAVLASLPVAASVVKQATNPRVAKTVNALRRGATIGYGTVLAPNASTKESE